MLGAVMRAYARALLALMLTLVAAGVVVGVSVAEEPSEGREASTQDESPPLNFSYAYHVLSGYQPGYDAASSTLAGRNLKLTCGWHGTCYDLESDDIGNVTQWPVTNGTGIDILAEGGQPVYAAFRAVRYDARAVLTAEVVDVIDAPPPGGGCTKVVIRILQGTDEVARVRYTHTLGSLHEYDPINLPTSDQGLSAYALTKVGRVLNTGEDTNPWCAGLGEHLHLGGTDHAPLSANLHHNRTPFTRDATTEAKRANEAAAEVDLASGSLTGDGFPKGHHPDPGELRLDTRLTDPAHTSTALYAYPQFCSNTWVFKIQSASLVEPSPSDVEPCRPASLSVEPGNRQVEVSWDDPKDPTLVGYQLRYKARACSR